MVKTVRARIVELQNSEARFRSLVDNAPDCVMMVGLDGTLKHINAAGLELFALERPEQVLDQALIDLFPSVSCEWLAKGLRGAKDGKVMQNTVMLYDKNGIEHWIDAVFSPLTQPDKSIDLIVGNFRDITATKAQAAELEHISFHDSLTDLPNRARFIDRLEETLTDAQRESSVLAVLIMDLDRFKEVNDTLGHHLGDQLLQQVALRLQNVLRQTDTIARLGGDEFAVLMPTANEAQAIDHAQSIIKTLEQRITLSDLDIQITTSIGITMFPNHGRNAATLMQRADVAMYYAKRHKAGYAVYCADIDPHSLRRLTLVGELRHAIDNNELFLHFQPKVLTGSRSTCGVEALVRWKHPAHGDMGPVEFIPLAEETGLIRPLTRWVLDAALEQWSKWSAEDLRIGIAINLSVRNLMDPKLSDLIASRLKRWNVPPQFLEMEITESDLMADPERALRVLGKLDEMGIKLSIDDFGTGYSSLSYLKQLPVDEIKIDKSFVMGMENDENDAMIVDATIDLAHKLGKKVVAEGVESQRAMELLEKLGCDIVQGYYIGRPVNKHDLFEWIQLNQMADLAPSDGKLN